MKATAKDDCTPRGALETASVHEVDRWMEENA